MSNSGFHIFGIGRAVVDKKGNSNTLLVSMVELLPSLNGVLTHKENTLTKTTNNPRGGKNNIKQNVAAGITCEWWDLGSNRITSPDVVKDERVIIWRKGDSSTEYFWTPTNLDVNKRTTEHVVNLYSDTDPKNRKPKRLNKENSYSTTVSTKNQYIEILTCKNNGEKFRYQLKIDAANNYAVLKDDVGNRIHLNSKDTLIELVNKDKTHVKLTKKDIDIYTPGNFIQKTDGDYTLTVGGNYTATIGGNESKEIGGSCSWVVAGTVSLDAPQVNWTVPIANFTTDKLTVSGVVQAMALIIMGGGAGGGPSCSISGATICNGSFNCTDTITTKSLVAESIQVGAGGINSTGDVIAPNI